MNNVGNFSSDNILGTEDILNQSLAPLLGDENTSIGIDAKSGAYVDSISREAASLSLIQSIIPEPNTPQRPLRNAAFSSIPNYNNLDALTGAEVVDESHGQLDNQAILKSALALSESKLQTFLERIDSLENLNQAFGNNWHPSSALALIKDLIAEKALPEIQILAASTLKAKGAFDGQKIYLSQQLIDSQDTNEISSVFLEEFGHYLDSRLNTTDSEGDEGEIFSRLIQNLPLDLATLKAEDDFGSLNLDGQEIAIEKANEAGIFTVNSYGKISVDWMADAGSYQGELAIFSLKGMETLTPGGSEYIKEAARRALTNKDQGYVILSDATEGAKLNGELGEANQNQGNYMGVRDFAFAPGTPVAFLLVPVGTVQEVFDNPSTEGNQRPLFSLASANPLGKTHLGKLAEDTFVWEDIRFDNNSDADYNDLVVSVQGLTGEVTLLEQLIAPQHDWRSTQSAQEMMELVHTNSASDTSAPKISFNLVEDSGFDKKDGITNNPAISGKINDSSPISKLEAQLNNGNWLEITDTLAADSSFALSQEKLAQIFGKQLADGNYQLAIKATDTSNNTSEAIKLNFSFDTTAPISPGQLELLNDNNKVTSNNQPVVTGIAPTAAQVKLYSGNTLIGEGTVVDEQWQITSNTVLTDGTQKLSAVAIDAAGNLSRNSNLELLIDTIAPQLIITSPQYDALIAKGTRLQGTVNGTGSDVMQLSYQFNDLVEVPIAFDSNGRFDVVLNLDKKNSPHLVRLPFPQ